MSTINALNDTYETLQNMMENGKIAVAMTSNTDADGKIAELMVATAAESNIHDVLVGSFNHFKVLHAKKGLVCRYTKGATAADDKVEYDIIVNYNNTNSATLKTVLYTVDLSPFVSRTFADAQARTDAISGNLANSADLSIDWTNKLKSLTDLSDYLDKHNLVHEQIKIAAATVKPFVQ